MPDDNKFKVLRDIGYTIPVTCDSCVNSEFPNSKSPWGTCTLPIAQYEHLKHTGERRGVSIHREGSCQFVRGDLAKVTRKALGAHTEFVCGDADLVVKLK